MQVTFAGKRVRGVVAELADETDVPASRLRELSRVLGPHAWMTEQDLDLVSWAAERYGGTRGDVARHALPDRRVKEERRAEEAGWFPPGRGQRPTWDGDADVDPTAWARYGDAGQALLEAVRAGRGARYWRPLPDEDVAARVAELAGVCLAGGRDVLLLTPGPRSPIADAVGAAFGDIVADVRGRGPGLVHRGWLRARCGQARVVIGSRSVAFWPLERLGLAVVLDEANPAYKERRAPYHHAREVVLERARRTGAVALLHGLVPSAAAWAVMQERRVSPVVPRRDLERERAPAGAVDDASRRARFGDQALGALKAAVRAGQLGVVLASRRGEGTALACRECGRRLASPTCDSSMRHLDRSRVGCDRCGWSSRPRPRCRRCGHDRFVPLAAGAAHLGEELRRTFPDVPVAVLEGYDQPVPEAPAIVIMTRGSVFAEPPGDVGAVVTIDLDGQLRRPGLDAAEDALRLVMTAAAWTAGSRHHGPPRVVVQTRSADHHAVRALVGWDPGGFWRDEAVERAPLRFPPVASAIRLEAPIGAGLDLAATLPPDDQVLGPLEGDDGRARYLITTTDRVATVGALRTANAGWSKAGVDVRLDVDPVDVA